MEIHIKYNDGHCEIKTAETTTELCIPAHSLAADAASLEIHDERFTANTGEEGYMVLPNIELGAHHAFRTYFKKREDAEESFPDSNIEIFGICKKDFAWMATVTGMRYEYTLVVGVKNGKYYLYPRFTLTGKGAYEDIVIHYTKLEGPEASWQGMARCFRKKELADERIHLLKDKKAERPVLDEFCETIEVRIRLAWKPVPSTIDDQTLENEPPVHAELTFSDVEDIIEEFHRHGIEKVHFCLVGWNISGHDGRFPDLFPVEPKCGTAEQLKKVIAKARSYGYLITAHTNLIEGYSIASRFDLANTLRQLDGTPKRGGNWGGGKSYYLCPEIAFQQYVRKDMQDLKELGFRGEHYFDVFSITSPDACYDPAHPLTKKENAQWRNKILLEARNAIGAVGSEGPWNFCADTLDYVLYAAFFLQERQVHPMCDEYIPLWFMIYHGIQLYNSFAASVNAALKSDRTLRVWNYIWGGRPLYYINSRFISGSNPWGSEDLRYHPKDYFLEQMPKIKKDYDFYRSIRHLQFESLVDYENISGKVIRSTYSNGESLIGNLTGEVQNAGGMTLQPYEVRLEKWQNCKKV